MFKMTHQQASAQRPDLRRLRILKVADRHAVVPLPLHQQEPAGPAIHSAHRARGLWRHLAALLGDKAVHCARRPGLHLPGPRRVRPGGLGGAKAAAQDELGDGSLREAVDLVTGDEAATEFPKAVLDAFGYSFAETVAEKPQAGGDSGPGDVSDNAQRQTPGRVGAQ